MVMSKSMYCVGKIVGGNITMIVADGNTINKNSKVSNGTKPNKIERERG